MKKIAAYSLAFLPMFAFAQQGLDTTYLQRSIRGLTDVVNSAVPLLLGVAVIVFIWGIIRYMLAKGPEDKAHGKTYIISGIIAIASILAIWGLARLLIDIFGLRPTQLDPSQLPLVPRV